MARVDGGGGTREGCEFDGMDGEVEVFECHGFCGVFAFDFGVSESFGEKIGHVSVDISCVGVVDVAFDGLSNGESLVGELGLGFGGFLGGTGLISDVFVVVGADVVVAIDSPCGCCLHQASP